MPSVRAYTGERRPGMRAGLAGDDAFPLRGVEFQLPPVEFRLAAEDDRQAGLEVAGHIPLPEPHQPHRPGIVPGDGLGVPAGAFALRPAPQFPHFPDGGLDAARLFGLQIDDVEAAGIILVAAGKVIQQIPHRGDVQLLQPLGGFHIHAVKPLHRLIQPQPARRAAGGGGGAFRGFRGRGFGGRRGGIFGGGGAGGRRFAGG